MKILFDPQSFGLGYSGMYRYYGALFEGLREAGITVILPKGTSARHQPGRISILPDILHNGSVRIKRHLQLRNYYRAIEREKYDLLYITAPNHETGFLNLLNGRKPFVMTVHDTMQSVRGFHTYIEPVSQSTDLGFLAHMAKRVITVSEFTRNDLIERYYIEPEKTITVYLANFLNGEPEPVENLPDPYILFIGARKGRKNFHGWVKAVSSYLIGNPELNIVVSGSLTRSERYFAELFGIGSRIIAVENLTDQELKTLYNHALCLVYPSLYEGFGLPVIEAMSHGCPVIASNRASIPEVAGNAALLIDPLSKEEMIQSLRKVYTSRQIREELKQKGLKRAEKFQKESFIRQMILEFEKALA